MELKYYLRGLGLGIAITAVIMGIATSKNRTMTNEEIIARAKQLGMTEDNAVLTDINSDNEDEGLDTQSADEPGEPNNESAKTSRDDGASGESDVEDNEMIGDAGNDKSEDGEDASGIVKHDSEEAAETLDSGEESEAIDSGEGDGVYASRDLARTTDTGTDAEAGELETESSDRTSAVSKESVVITIGSGDGSYSVSKKLADVGAIVSASDFDTYLCQNGYDKKIRTGTYTIPADASDEQMARIITGRE